MSAGHSAGQDRGGVPAGKHEDEAIVSFERRWFEEFRRGEFDKIDRMLPADYTFITSEGQLMNKSEGFRRMEQIHFDKLEVKRIAMRRYGNVAVLVTNLKVAATIGRRDMSGAYCHTRVYVQREGEWTPVSGQSTRTGK